MDMRKYITDTFRYNDYANKKVLEKIRLLPDKTQCIKFFSHLINCQYKWMARITHDPKAFEMSWWEPVYALDDLEKEWSRSLQVWLDFLSRHTDEEISKEVS